MEGATESHDAACLAETEYRRALSAGEDFSISCCNAVCFLLSFVPLCSIIHVNEEAMSPHVTIVYDIYMHACLVVTRLALISQQIYLKRD